ncbi:MAG: hypothetical protein Q9185_003372 [Variospora sp. 1 TL-2023]
MERLAGWTQRVQKYGTKRTGEIVENLGKNRLWQRQLKNILATTILVSICLIPKCSAVLGRAAYLGAITTVFAHPGRRFGELIETLILVVFGTTLGLSWSLLGLYLSSLVIQHNPPAAYSIRGIFLACALLFHGFLRSRAPRLLVFVLLVVIVSVVSLTSVTTTVTAVSATQIAYPILVALGVVLVVNLSVFPEFSAGFLGDTTIGTLHDTAEALGNAGHYFTEVSPPADGLRRLSTYKKDAQAESHRDNAGDCNQKSYASIVLRKIRRLQIWTTDSDADEKTLPRITLQKLVGAKQGLRSNLARCKKAQSESNFEIAFAVLPPRELKPISSKMMRRLIANAVAVIGACESKFLLLGESDPQEDLTYGTANQCPPESPPRHFAGNVLKDRGRPKAARGEVVALKDTVLPEEIKLDLVKPRREIEFGDVKLLEHLLQRIAPPYTMLSTVIARAIDCVTLSIAYSYDVPKLPAGARPPKGLCIDSVDRTTEELSQALLSFDREIAEALEGAVDLQELNQGSIDIMPREEIFLVASFVLNLRQAASHIEEMLKHSKFLVLQRQSMHNRRRFYAPRIKWSKWLYSGGEEDEVLPATGRKSNKKAENDEKADDEDDMYHHRCKDNLIATSDRKADLEAGKSPGSSRTRFAGPYLLPSSYHQHTLRIRGALADSLEWAQNSDDLLYAFKLTVTVFLVTWPAFIASWNTWYSLNRGLWAALQLVFVMEVSIGNSVMMFLLRGIGTTVGCFWGWAALEARSGNRVVVAAMVCVGLIPSTYVQLGSKHPKAGQDELTAEIAGIEEAGNPNVSGPKLVKRFERASREANAALAAAEAFLPLCSKEPRIKGSFEGLSLIYSEILFVLHQIVDRMDNMLQLRIAYGSGPLEEFNAQFYPYRRNVAGAITMTLFAVETSLKTQISLPQFFPSARLSHLRMINRVREVVQQAGMQDPDTKASDPVRNRAVRRNHMAWNAASAARVEIIEYLEELIDLAKLLVGANEFRSGLLMRTTYQEYTQKSADVAAESKGSDYPGDMAGEVRDNFIDQPTHPSRTIRRRRLTTIQSSGSAEDKVPASLQRIQSRKTDACLRHQVTTEGWT